MRALDIAGTGMQAQQTNVEVISNNIANMSTTGFKRQRAEFQDLIYQNLRRVGSNSSDNGTIVPSGAQIGLGVKTASVYRITEQGNLQQTGNNLDMAIQGNGYFQVTLPSGETAYTRDDNLFIESAASGNPASGAPGSPGYGGVMQGFVETSNVNVVTEITNLITAQRAYEMNSKVITTSDDMLQTLTNLH
jgi:flagellar basal-body rod protein FlgG